MPAPSVANSPAKLHFHSLEALRFFAFLKVCLLHLPLAIPSPTLHYLTRGGGIGVQFFFVLSGFTFGGSVALSSLSFHCFEQPFLRLRDRLTQP